MTIFGNLNGRSPWIALHVCCGLAGCAPTYVAQQPYDSGGRNSSYLSTLPQSGTISPFEYNLDERILDGQTVDVGGRIDCREYGSTCYISKGSEDQSESDIVVIDVSNLDRDTRALLLRRCILGFSSIHSGQAGKCWGTVRVIAKYGAAAIALRLVLSSY
jgi:hypothetical protein